MELLQECEEVALHSEFFKELDFDEDSIKDFCQTFSYLIDEVVSALDNAQLKGDSAFVTEAIEETHRIKGTLSYMEYDLKKFDLDWFHKTASSENINTVKFREQLVSLKASFTRDANLRIKELNSSSC